MAKVDYVKIPRNLPTPPGLCQGLWTTFQTFALQTWTQHMFWSGIGVNNHDDTIKNRWFSVFVLQRATRVMFDGLSSKSRFSVLKNI